MEGCCCQHTNPSMPGCCPSLPLQKLKILSVEPGKDDDEGFVTFQVGATESASAFTEGCIAPGLRLAVRKKHVDCTFSGRTMLFV